MHSIVLGGDIGGTHITTCLADISKERLVDETYCRRAVDASGEAADIIDHWCATIRQAWQLGCVKQTAIGLAMPGPFDYENGICLIHQQEKYRSLYSLNIRQLLSEKLEIDPNTIRFINDACGFLQGEVFAGSAKGLSKVLGVTLGTGLGSALYDRDRLLDADLWQMPYQSGIAEDFLSTGWFIKKYKELTGESIQGAKELLQLKPTAKDTIKAIFSAFGENLANFIVIACQKHQVSQVVIGGNIANAHAEFLDVVKTSLAKSGSAIEIKIATLGEAGVIAGAAALFNMPETSFIAK